MRITDTENIRNSIEPETIGHINDIEQQLHKENVSHLVQKDSLREMWVYVNVKRMAREPVAEVLKRKVIITHSTDFSFSTMQMDNITFSYEKYRRYKTEDWKYAFFSEVNTYLNHYFHNDNFIVTNVCDVKMNIGI